MHLSCLFQPLCSPNTCRDLPFSLTIFNRGQAQYADHCAHDLALDIAGDEQVCRLIGLDESKVYYLKVASTLDGFSEPGGAALDPVTPLGQATTAGICYADYAEIALEWQPAVSG